MAKIKPVKGKKKKQPMPSGALGCVILLISAMALVLLFMYFILKYGSATG